jgi:sugar phosphate isomerase/epimerase
MNPKFAMTKYCCIFAKKSLTMQRRIFLKNTALALAATGIAPNLLSAEEPCRKKAKMGLQLYTLRQALEKDLVPTLRKVAEMGYTTLEQAGYQAGLFYGKKPAEFNKILINEGLSVVSGHILTGRQSPNIARTMVNDFERVVDDMKAIDQKYIVCAWLFPEERTCLDDYKTLAHLLNKCGEKCAKYGIQMAYHNHDFEFQAINTVIPYDILLRETDSDLIKFEMDMYWMTKAKQNPLRYFEQNPERFPLWHVKDMDKLDPNKFAEVGLGTIDFAKIFEAQKKAGLKYYFVEQDDCYDRDPLDSIKISYDYLKKVKF